ncbi:MAG: hypothetical protein M1831_000014 [Alyxoria varia]|nr:MAG: hypothetical protein M1831_000014 [Alyxoria varia]
MLGAILVVIITVFFPPVGTFLVAGCGADLLINIALTILGYFPGHIHAFYVEYQYYTRRDIIKSGGTLEGDAPGVFSDRIHRGGGERIGVQPPPQNVPPQNQGYGTMA